MKAIVFAIAATLASATAAQAELLRVEIKTLGMDWETCAHAVRVAMQKVDGVRSVQVSLKEGATTLELRPDNTVTLAQLRSVIKNNGFVSKEAQVIARGSVRPDGFDVAGSGERLSTVSPPTGADGGRWRFTVPAPR